MTSFNTLGNGMSNFTAQNLGAMQTVRVREGYKGCLKMMAGIATLFVLVYVFFGGQVIRLFLNDENSGSLAVGVEFLLIGVAVLLWRWRSSSPPTACCAAPAA